MVGPKTNVQLNILASGMRSDIRTIDEVITRRLLEKDDDADMRHFLRELMALTACTTEQLARWVCAVRDEPEERKS